jgi:anti-sigma factor RsiW
MAKAKCRELEPLFASYVDGEAAPDERAELDAHLTGCSPCRDRLAGERTARDVLHAHRARLRAVAPDLLRARCAASATVRPGAARALLSERWVPLSLAATLVIAVGWVFLFGINDRVQALAAQLALDHVKCFQFPPSHVPADAAAASREWAQAQGWGIVVPASTGIEQLQLIGLRRCLSTHGGVAHVMYRWHGAPLSVYVINRNVNGVADGEAATEEIAKLGEEAVIWSTADRTYAVVARGQPAELRRVAAYVRQYTH